MQIILNGASNSGKGTARWNEVRRSLRSAGHRFQVAATTSAAEGAQAVQEAISAGEQLIVAAGGDGTVNGVLNALMELDESERRDVRLGAIGLGSSNDFHKPIGDRQKVGGRPVRLDAQASRAHDVGAVRLVREDGHSEQRYFLLNGAVGLVAKGNAFFNTPRRDVRSLKRAHSEVAIVYSALYTIVTHSPVSLRLSLDGGPWEALELTNLAVLKKPEFAGGMRYDTEVRCDDGSFDVNLWYPMQRWRILEMIVGLYRGRFRDRPGTECRRAQRVTLESDTPFHLELDGEVGVICRAEIEVLPRAIQVCS